MKNTLEDGVELYYEYKETLIDLYIDSFYPQHTAAQAKALLRQNISHHFDQIMAQGFIILSFEGATPNGAMMLTSPNFDPDMPSLIKHQLKGHNSLYIAEVFVAQSSRGKGYGRQLFEALFALDKHHSRSYIIRVMSQNKRAIRLYESCSFVPQVTIKQIKMDHNENKMTLEKLYLTRIID